MMYLTYMDQLMSFGKYMDAINRWDLEAMEELPEYMKVCYSGMYDHVNEMVQDASKDLGLDILPYIKDQVRIMLSKLKTQWVCYTRSLHVEAGWFYDGYMPTLDEYFQNGWISIGLATGLAYAFFGVLEDSKTEHLPLEFFENWSESELFYWPSFITRLLDDLTTCKGCDNSRERENANLNLIHSEKTELLLTCYYGTILKLEMERGETANSIQCYCRNVSFPPWCYSAPSPLYPIPGFWRGHAPLPCPWAPRGKFHYPARREKFASGSVYSCPSLSFSKIRNSAKT
ncbi:3R-linalool synthase-like protein [Theobroma cacao]|uniref:3R-linalool synthase-like protein n=1 Tax=Theobroma cacao TaxID=3641 RepID=A0A061F9D1_THECC|nr:3R-linalool synthase-like protein [Theobroma cacao]